MGLIDQLEKLINEHGSAAILREHLALLKSEQSALERKNRNLELECQQLRADVEEARRDARMLREQLELDRQPGAGTFVCDHCGSTRLKRTGSRPDPAFGDVGVKQGLFSCLDCGKQSAFTIDPDRG